MRSLKSGLILLLMIWSVSEGDNSLSCWDPATTVTSPRDTASLYSGMTLSGGFANYSDASVLKICNSKVGLTLTKNGYALQSMRDLTNSMECLSSSITTGDLWRITVRSPSNSYTTLNSHSFTASAPVISYENNNNTMLVTLSWSNISVAGDTGKIGVTAYIRCDKDDPVLRWKISVDNNLTTSGLWQIIYPVVNRLGYNGQSDVAAPNVKNGGPTPGDLARAASGAQRMGYNHEHPGWLWTMQFLSVSCGPNSVVYTACQDPNSNYKGWTYDLTTEFTIYAYPPNMTVPGADYNQEWDFCMGPISGDWFDATQRYRAWALQQKWCSSGPLLTRSNMSTSIKEIDYWLKASYARLADPNRWDANQVAPLMKAAKSDCNQVISYFGGNIANHWYHWHKHGDHTKDFDTWFGDYLPPVYGVQDTFAYYNSQNMLHTPYMSGVYYDPRNTDWATASQSAMINLDGSIRTWKDNDGIYTATMDPNCSWWRNKMSGICHDLYTNYSCKGVYLDVLGGSGPDYFCFNATHGHPLGGGHWYADGEKALLDTIRRDSPGISVVTEHFGEHLIDKIDAFLVWPRMPYNCPLIASVYHDYTLNFGCGASWFPWYGEDTTSFAAKIGRDLIWGSMMGWYGMGNDLNRPSTPIQRDYNWLRAKTRDFLLYGTMIRPPAFNQMPDIVSVNYLYTFDGTTYPNWPTQAIQRTAWKAHNGSIGLAILNIASTQKLASFNVSKLLQNFNVQSVQLISATSIQNMTWPGSKLNVVEVNVPAYEAVVVAFNPKPACDGNMLPILVGDVNHDCYVNLNDLGDMSYHWLDNNMPPCTNLADDIDNDCNVNFTDYAIFAQACPSCIDPFSPCNYDLPKFIAAGDVASGTAAITPSLPIGIAENDILLLFLETANQPISIDNQNGGVWAEVDKSPQCVGATTGTDSTATRLTVFWSRYNGTQGAPTTTNSGDHQIGRMIAIRGATTSGNPCDVTGGGFQFTASTSGSIPGATTINGNTLVVAAAAVSLPDSTSSNNCYSWSNSSLTNLTECIDNTTSTGNGGGIGVAIGRKAVAGNYYNTTFSTIFSSNKAMMSIAIKSK